MPFDLEKPPTKDEEPYFEAMAYLESVVPGTENKTRSGVYKEKKKVYTDAKQAKTAALQKALDDAESLSDDPNTRRELYDKWVAVHAKTFNDRIQLAYMDWEVRGSRQDVDTRFAIVDKNVVMARVERSKVSCYRASSSVYTEASLIGSDAQHGGS